jgi:hypothetical protein
MIIPLPSFGKPRLLDRGTPPEQHVCAILLCPMTKQRKSKNNKPLITNGLNNRRKKL